MPDQPPKVLREFIKFNRRVEKLAELSCFELNPEFVTTYKVAQKTYRALILKNTEFELWLDFDTKKEFWVRRSQHQNYGGMVTKTSQVKFEDLFDEITDPEIQECLLFNLDLFKNM